MKESDIQPADERSAHTGQFQPATIADLPPDPQNPREISSQSAGGLGHSLRTFGDLSGITFNVRTGQLVSGHQRIQQLFKEFGPLPINRLDDQFGQIACPDGQIFHVRFVDWDESKQRSANVAANSSTITGTFVADKLDLYLTEIREKRIDDFDAMLLGELFEVETNQGDKGALKDQPVEKPPEMAWVLIGIPLVRFSEISAAIEALADNPNTTISTTANNG